MGCCCSRPAVHHDPVEQQHIQIPAPSTTAVASSPVEESPSLQKHPNKPLRRPRKWTSKRSWTREELDKAREEFFHVSMAVNDPAAWIIIQEVCKLLWAEEMLGEERRSREPSPGLIQAQGILEAAEITTPSGSIRTLYDSQGRKYDLPDYILCDPVNISLSQTDGAASSNVGSAAGGYERDDLSDSENEIADSEEVLRRKEEKGKGPEKTILATKSVFTVRLRKTTTTAFQDDITIPKVSENDTIGSLKERLMEEGRVRLFYRGQELADTKRLKEYRYVPGDVLSAMVT